MKTRIYVTLAVKGLNKIAGECVLYNWSEWIASQRRPNAD